jgi:hypothetical protein
MALSRAERMGEHTVGERGVGPLRARPRPVPGAGLAIGPTPRNPAKQVSPRAVATRWGGRELPGRAPLILLATVSALALGGCAQIKETGSYLGEQAGAAGSFVGDKFGAATSAVGRWASGRPEDDATSCYATERTAFYDAVSDVKTAESLVFGAQLAALVGLAVTVYSDSFITRLVSAGFSVTMVALIADIEADRTRIERVTSTFNDLMACRRGEAQRVKSEVGAGRLSRSAGEAQLNQLKALVEEDLVVARDTNQTLQARTTEFELSTEKAKEEVSQATGPEQAGEPPPAPEEQREREEQIQKAEAAVQTNQQALSQQSATIEQASDLPQSDAFELGLLDHRYRPGRPMAEA